MGHFRTLQDDDTKQPDDVRSVNANYSNKIHVTDDLINVIRFVLILLILDMGDNTLSCRGCLAIVNNYHSLERLEIKNIFMECTSLQVEANKLFLLLF